MTTLVYITSTPESQSQNSAGNMTACQFLQQAIERSADEDCILTDSPQQAEIIIFAESHLNTNAGVYHPSARVESHLVFKKFRSKCIIHNGSDQPCPTVPGLYPSLSKKWTSRLGCLGSPYLAQLNPYLESGHDFDGTVDWLASFMGSCARKPFRQRLVTIAQESQWADIECVDSTAAFIGSIRASDHNAHNELKKLFVRSILRSKFTLCPLGSGPSSYRIFEAMQAARTPVIISDTWSPPPGPDWDSFSIRIKESQITQIPTILRDKESQWESMGKLARQAWDTHYSPAQFGSEIIDLAKQVLDLQSTPRLTTRLYSSLYKLKPKQLSLLQDKLKRRSARMNTPTATKPT